MPIPHFFTVKVHSEKTVVDMLDRIVLEGMSVKDSLSIAANEDQAIIDSALLEMTAGKQNGGGANE